MALSINILRNNGGQVQLSTPVLPTAQADYFKLYWAVTSGGPYTYIKAFPNAGDATVSIGSALVYLYRTEIGLTPEDPFYVKVTSVKGVTESLLVDSVETSVPGEGGETNDDLKDDLATAVELHGYNQASQRWLRTKADAQGRLEIAGGGGGDATAANQVTEIGHLSEIEIAVESIEGKTPALGQAAMAASVPVVLSNDQSRVLTAESFTSALAPVSISVGAASVAIPTTPMAGRRSMVVYNNGNTELQLGIGGTNLIPLASRTHVVLDVTASVLVTASRVSGTFPVIVWEFA